MTFKLAPQKTSVLAFAAVGFAALILLLTVRTVSADGMAITDITPETGPTSGHTIVTIAGSEFPSNVDLEVTFDGIPAVTASVNIDGTVITAETPPHAAGTVEVAVTDSTDEDSDVIDFTYVEAPEIIGISPETGSEEGGTEVSIFGNNFADGAEVTFGGVAATAVAFVSEHELTATTPAGTGAVDVVVTNPDDQTDTLEDAFTYGEDEDTTGEIVSGGIPATGFGLFVFGGGTNEQLVEASGCPEATVTFFATNASGSFVTYIPGTQVGVVNAAWNALFPSGIPALQALIGKCA